MVRSPRPLRSPPSAAVIELWREYSAWLVELPNPLRDDEELDDSFVRFMLERRRMKEKERLRGVELRRSQKRNEQRKEQRA